jgi:hypothetical protein
VQKTIDEVLGEAAIRDLQRRYCRGIDRLDWDMVRSCFHADAETDYGFFTGSPDEFVAMARQGMTTYSATTHFIGNQLVEVQGDSAWAEHYVIAYHRCPADEQGPERDFICNFRYVDRNERRGGDWRIAHRVLLVDSWRSDAVGDPGSGPTTRRGVHGLGDPSFAGR